VLGGRPVPALLDNTIVNVALPSIQRQLDASPSTRGWTINAYVLSFAVLIMLGGKLGDRFGRKRMFLWVGAALTFAAAMTAFIGLRGVRSPRKEEPAPSEGAPSERIPAGTPA
jgi:MFS family permease